MLDSPAIFGGSTLSSPTCTKQWDIQVSAVTVTGASSNKTTASPGSYTCSWTNSVSTNGWDDSAVEIHASGSTAPSAPTGLGAVAMSTSRIDLVWNAPSNNGGSSITGYKIERSTNGGNSWSTLVSNTGSTNTLYADTGLSSSTTYTYRVSAINSIGTSSPSNTASATTFSTSTSNWKSSTGILMPLYCDPYSTDGSPCPGSGFTWQLVNNTKSHYPHVPIFVVVNPASGPCILIPASSCKVNADYQRGIANLTKSGINVLGYVDTVWFDYSANNTQKQWSEVKNEINDWNSFYSSHNSTMGNLGIKGIMFDDMQTFPFKTGNLTYYQNLTNYVHNNNLQNLTYSFGNPGSDTDRRFQNTVDLMDIYETYYNDTSFPLTNATLRGDNTISGITTNPQYWHTLYDKDTYSFLQFNKTNPTQKEVQARSVYGGLMYFTDNTGCGTHTTKFCITNNIGFNPWNTTSTYLNNTLAPALNNTSIVSAFQAFDKSSGNALISIPKILINQSNNANYFARNGTTPFTYNETSGWKFSFTAPLNFSSYNFCSWTYGSTNETNSPTIVVSPIATMIYNVTYTKNPHC